MGLFDKFSKDKSAQGLPDILSIPCDYNGYDLIFEEGMTNPVVYSDITALVTNNKSFMIFSITGSKLLMKRGLSQSFSRMSV